MSSASGSGGGGGGASSAAAAVPLSPADAADVAVLESTLFRFASCEDDKFESTVGRVLPKLLPLFLRPSAAIREHLVLICNHVNKRLNALPQLRLPAADLLQLYQAHGSDVANPNLAYFVTFVLMYIEKAFARCGVAERTRLAHQLLPGLALRTPQHQKSILHTFFRCLSPSDYAMEQVPSEEFIARWASLRASADDQRVMLEFMLDAMMWAPVFVQPAQRLPQMGPTPLPTVAGQAAAAASAAASEEKQAEQVPEGLSPAALAVLTLDGTLSSSQLQTLKSAVLHFAAHVDVFSESQLLPLAIAGSCVGNSDVVHLGESMLKRLKNVDLEDAALVQSLFAMYLGSLDSAATPAERRRRPAPYSMKLKLVERLTRSRASVSMLQPALKLLMDTLFSPASTPKLKNAGLVYCNCIINNCSPAHINTIAPVLLNALLKFLGSIAKPAGAVAGAGNGGGGAGAASEGDDGGSGREQQTSTGIIQAQMRGVTYQLIGQLSLKRPDLFNKNLKMMSLFFRALQEERVDTVLQDIHDGLSMLRAAFVGVDEGVQTQLQQVLLQMVVSSDKRVRLNALQCLNRLFNYQDVLARYLCVSAADQPDLSLKDEALRGLVPFIPRNELEAERNRMRKKREQERKEEMERKKREQDAAAAPAAAAEAKEGEALEAAAVADEEEAKSPLGAESPSPEPAFAAAAAVAGASSTPAGRQPHALMSLLLPIEAAKVPYPSFASLMAFAHAHILGGGAAPIEGRFTPAQVEQLAFLKANVAFDVRTLPRLLDYLYETLKQNAFYADVAATPGTDADAGASGKEKATVAGLTDEEIDALVSRYAGKLIAQEEAEGIPADQRSLLLFQSLVEHALEQRVHDVQSNAAQHLVRLVFIRPALFAPVYAAKLAWVETQMTSGIQALRSAMAQLLHLIAGHLQPDAALQSLISTFSGQLAAAEKVVGPSRDDVTHGCLLALGVLAAEAMRRDKKAGVDADSDVAARESAPFPFAQLEAIVLEVARRLDANTFNRTPHITAAAIISLGRMGEVGRLPVPINGGVAAPAAAATVPDGKAATPAAPAVPATRSAIVSQLLSMVKSSGERKAERVVEESIKTLSLMCAGDRSVSLLNEVVEGFFAAANSKHEELHFAIGQAIASIAKQHQHPLPTSAPAAASSTSLSLQPEPVVAAASSSSAATASPNGPISEKQDLLCAILPRLFKLVSHGSSLQRTAATTWLLCIVKFASDLPAVGVFFERIQASFSVALTDSSQFVQEVAAKGQATLYEMSSGPAQQKLIDDLLRTFSSGQRRVTGDTVITLDEEKGEYSTYKELLEVAKDMNKPDLFFQFSDLAGHHAIWSSKLGAAFSLSSMLQANAKLTAQLGSILPKLFRYQYDTNTKIQDSMKKLWASLVPNPREAIQQHFALLMEDLLESMGNRQYRVRNSACLALADLVHGRGEEQLGPYLERLWSSTFRLLDDVNEHVRKAATALAGTLSHVSIRLCDTKFSNRAAAQRSLAIVLPVLLSQGVTSKAKEIQSVSIRSVLAIIRVGGVNLRPHLATLVGTLLESMSNLEPQVFSYLQFHSASMAMSEEQLERARLSLASGGVLAEALSSCLLVVDDESIPSLIAKLTDIIGTGIGLPTLTAAAKFVVSLAGSKSAPAMREYVAPLIQQLFQGLNDQSPTLRKSYADALGYCCKIAKKKRVEKLILLLIDMYISDKSSENSRMISGFAMRSIVRQAGDVVRANFMLEVVPVVWLASHDNTPGNGDIAKSWADAFEELVPGMDAAISLYQQECVALIRRLLESQVYALRHIALLALKHLVLACKVRFAEEMDAILTQVVRILPGRLWTGKEVAMDVLVFLAQECGGRMSAGQARTIMDALRAECARNRTDYRREAIRCTGKAALCFPFLKGDEVLLPMRAVLQPILDLTASSSKEEQSGAATPAAAASAAPSGAVASSSSSSSSAAGEEKESGPDVLLVTYTYACLADLFPSAKAAVTTLHALRVQGKEGAAEGVDDADWYAAQAAHVDWIVDSLLAGLEKGFVWSVRVSIWTALRRVFESLYGGEDLEPATAGASDVVSKRSYGASLVRPDLLAKVAAALTAPTGLGEPKYPLVKARAIELLQAIADKQTVWCALVSDSNRDVCRALNAQLLSMRADTDATVLRLAPTIQTKLAAAIAH